MSVKTAIDADGPASLFHLPISYVALQQLTQLAEDLNGLQEPMKRIPGHIFGPLHFSPHLRLINILLVIDSCMMHLNGSGSQTAKTNTRCSFGFY